MFSRFFIDRPIFAAVVSIVIALAGGLSLLILPVAQYPEISPPSISVAISYPGASAQVVADTVAAPIEQQVNGIPGMLYMSSQSGNDGTYSLSVTFEIGTDLNTALVVVQNRVMLAMPQLPTAVQLQGITIRKRTPDILQVITFTSPDGRYDNIYLSNFATVNIRDELLRIDGVSDINVFGQRDYSMRLWLDPQKLAANNLTAMDVAAAVRSQNIEAAPGRIGQPPTRRDLAFQWTLDTLGRLHETEQFGQIIVKSQVGKKPPALVSSAASGGGAPAGGSMGAAFTTGAALNTGVLGELSSTNLQNLTGTPTSPIAAASPTPTTLNYPTFPTMPASMQPSGKSIGPATTPPFAPATQLNVDTPPGSTSTSNSASTSDNSSGTGLNIVGTDIASPGSGGGTSGAASTITAGGAVGATGMAGGALDGGPDPASAIIRMSDVARIELGAQQYNNGAGLDGKPAVGLAIHLLPGANALDVAERVKAKMDELKPRFPPGVEASIPYDTTPYIRESVNDVKFTLFEAIGLVAFVVLLFLQNWRASLIPLLAVPVAILGAFAVMAALGFTINNISLFGLVLAIGIVVDDAIVVVENVERWLEQGYSSRDAAHKAMEEVTGPVVAISVVLCAVFIPCAFVGGITGQFYRQFAVTITASMVFSTINSLTLSPALAALLLKKHEPSAHRGLAGNILHVLLYPLSFAGKLFTRAFSAGTNLYVRILGWLIRLSLIVLLLYAGLLALTYWVFSIAPTGFVPDQDQGRLIVSVQLPDSASLERSTRALQKVDEIARNDPAVDHVATAAGMSLVMSSNASNFGTAFVILKPFAERRDPHLSANAAMARLRRIYAREVPEADVKVFGAPPIPGLSVASGFKMMIEDRGGLGLVNLQNRTDEVVAKLQKEPSVIGVLSQFRSKTPQLFLDIDRSKVQSLGVNLNDVNITMQTYLGSLYVTSFNEFGRHWQVTLQAEGRFRTRPEDVALLQVRNKWGEMVPLGTLVTLREIEGPVTVSRYNLYTAAAVSGVVRPDASSSEAIDAVNRVARETLPRSMAIDWTELMFLQLRAGNTAIHVFFLAIVFVFLALAALYESWALPLAVILVVPLCLLCSISGVLLSGKGVDIFVQIGLIVLVGLACKNAILIVEFAEVLQRQGKSRREAAVEASRLRVRPIIMTSMAFILGVAPLILASGAGAEMRRSLGIAVFSGMLGVTLFGIFLTPVFFERIQRAVEANWFSSRGSRFLGGGLLGAVLGAIIGYLLAQLQVGGLRENLAIGAASGAVLAIGLPAIRQRMKA